MTVAVSCNLSEGVILGVDSAVTLPDHNGNVAKVYENAEKLFQIRKKPIGVATYGIASFDSRGIGSYIREFELKNPNGIISEKTNVAALVEGLRFFFWDIYSKSIIPSLEKETGKKFDQLEGVPRFGLVVGGFSDGEFLSEVWNIDLPFHKEKGSAIQSRAQGQFGTNWFATFEPIRRYIMGHDPALIERLLLYMDELRGRKLSEEEVGKVREILAQHEYPIPFDAMPIEEGVSHTRFLVDLVINHHRYAVGAPIVGGKARIGRIAYSGEEFEILGLS